MRSAWRVGAAAEEPSDNGDGDTWSAGLGWCLGFAESFLVSAFDGFEPFDLKHERKAVSSKP